MATILDIFASFKDFIMKYDYYLFDLDNCLLYIPNVAEYFDEVLINSLEEMGLNEKNIPAKVERDKFWFSGIGHVNLLERWGISDVHLFWKYFDDFDYVKRKELVKRNEMYIFEDVKPTMKKLRKKGKYLGLISNTADYIIEYILNKFRLKNYFQVVFGMNYTMDVSLAKPSPSGILSVLKNFNCDPICNKILMVGDSKDDIFAAKQANVDACLVKRDTKKYSEGFVNWEYKPDFIIKNINELISSDKI